MRVERGIQRLTGLGAALLELAALAPGDFAELLRIEVWRRLIQEIELVDRLLRVHDGPPYWRCDVERRRDALVRVLETAGRAPPWEAAPPAAGADTPELVRMLVARFGARLRAWPALFAVAAELRRSGQALMTPA